MNHTSPDPSVRLRSAMAVGTQADPGSTDGTGDTTTVTDLIARCAEEPDFFVRDMLTWALTRFPTSVTVPLLLDELRSTTPQARSQALHTLSKIGDTGVYPHITDALLQDVDDEVARTAWRTAVGLAPDHERQTLAARLSTQLGRGDRELRRSLSRALVLLDEHARDTLASAVEHPDSTRSRRHAVTTTRMLDDPELSFDEADNTGPTTG